MFTSASKMIRSRRSRSMLIRQSQARRRAGKQDNYNFTVDLKEKVDFSSELTKTTVPETEVKPEKTEPDNDKAGEVTSHAQEKPTFPSSRTIMSAVARKDLELLEELLSSLPPAGATETPTPQPAGATDAPTPPPETIAPPSGATDSTMPPPSGATDSTMPPPEGAADSTTPPPAGATDSVTPAPAGASIPPAQRVCLQAELNHALMMAITNKDAGVMERLLDAGADMHYFDGIYPMMLFAVDNRATEVFDLLLKHSKSNNVNSMCGNLIHAAARTGDINILKQVVGLGIDINMKAKSSQTTPLHDAVRSVKFIVKKKPPSLFSFNGTSAIEWNSEMPNGESKCRKRSHIERDSCTAKGTPKAEAVPTSVTDEESGYDMRCIDYLIENGCDLHAKDVNGKTALHEAAIIGNVAVARRLIQAGADINITDAKHHTPMMYAIVHNHFVELAKVLCDESTLHKPVTKDGEYYIHLACAARNVRVLRHLISRHCDVNVTYDGMTPLMYAIEQQQFTCADVLLDETACDVTFQNANGQSAISILCENTTLFASRAKLLKRLVARGADVNQPDASGVTPLLIQLGHQNKEWLQCLLENGADVNFISTTGEYPLLLACVKGDEEMLRTLIQFNADMNMTSRVCHDSKLIESEFWGRTPLQVALQRQDAGMVTLLLAAGCSTIKAATWLNGDDGQVTKEYFDSEHGHLMTHIKNTPTAPLTLQDLARCQIRAKTGPQDAISKYNQLPLPSLLKKYLDIDTCLSESELFLDSLRDI